MNTRWIVMVVVCGAVMALCATASAKEHVFECAGVSFETPESWKVEVASNHVSIKDPNKAFHFFIMCVKGQKRMGEAVGVFKKIYVDKAASFQVTNKDRTRYETKGGITYSLTEQKAVYKLNDKEDAGTFTASIRSYFMLPSLDNIVYITDYRLDGSAGDAHDKDVKAFIGSFARVKK